MKKDYTKKPKSFLNQVKILKKRGLRIQNIEKAEKVLENISYNRLSNYWYPFLAQPKDDEIFIKGTDFETVFKIYQFDSELRLIMFYAIEQIEIAIRTQIIFHLSIKYKSGFWFEHSKAFKSYPLFIDLLKKISENTKNSNQEYIKKYRDTYNQYLPPSWKSFETLSFNTLFSVFKNLKENEEQIKISKHFGLHHEVFKSWIETIIYIRNICAHHSRLWNIELTKKPIWPKSTNNPWVLKWENRNQETNNKELNLYAALCVTIYLLDTVNPYNKFRNKLNDLLKSYPEIKIKNMGFPENWKEEKLWSKLTQ